MTDQIRPITRALISVSDKTGLVDFARALAGARRRAGLDRRHRARRWPTPGSTVTRRVGAHRLSRDDGRPGQDAASRRCMAACSRSATTRSTPAAMARARHRPIDLLVVNLYPFEATVAKGADLRRLHREHRHRRPGDDPRRRQEPRRRRGRGRSRRLRARCSTSSTQHDGATTLALRKKLAAKAYARTAAYDAAISNWFAQRARRRRAGVPRLRRQARGGAALRREPAPAGGVLPHGRSSAPASPPRGRCRASSSPTTTSTTPTRPSNASPSSIPSAPPRSRSSSTPIPAASPRARASLDAYRKALRLRSGLGLRRHRRAQPHARRRGRARDHRDLHRGDHRARRDRRGDRDRRRQEEPAPAARRRPARSARRRADGEVASPAACWCSRATTPWSTTWSSRSSPSARRPTPSSPTCAFAFRVAKHVKSNAIVYAKDRATVGIGAGQMSRVDAARIAARKAAGRGEGRRACRSR